MEIDIIRKIKDISLDKKHRFYFIAKYIVENGSSVSDITITQLAKATYSSASTINRFTKYLNLSGYKELIHIIKYFNYTLVETDEWVKNNSYNGAFYQKYHHQVLKGLEETFNFFSLQENIVTDLVERLKKAERINVVAVGGTYNIARDFQQILLRFGFNIVGVNNFHTGYFLTKQSNEKTLNIFVSYSGETKELITLANICKENNSQVVAISKKSNNTLSRIADLNLHISSSDPIDRIISLTNRLSLIFYLDMIIYKILFTDLEYYQNLLEKTALKKF